MTNRQGSSTAAPSYYTVLRGTRVASFLSCSAAGRLGISVVPLSIILMVANGQNSFAAAGLCGGSFAVTAAVLSPARARLVDTKGTALALGLLTVPFLFALAAVTLSAPGPLPFTLTASAFVGAFIPPIGASTKAQLSTTFLASVDVQRAYAVDTVVDISVLMAGPVIAGSLIGLTSPPFTITAAATLVVAGCIGMRIRELSPAAPARARQHERALTWRVTVFRPAVAWPLVWSMIGAGAALGAIEIAVPAFATTQGSPAASGAILGLFFGVSALSSLVYGSRHWTISVARRHRAAVLALAVASLPLSLSYDLASLAILILLPGVFFGPALMSAYLMAEESTPGAQRAEAIAWSRPRTMLAPP